MITAIEIENFKAIRDRVRVEFKPITLLFGPNSAGKSTVIQALHYAREVFERNNVNADRTVAGGTSVDLGGFASFVHGHDLRRGVSLRFDLDLQGISLPEYLYEPDVAERHDALVGLPWWDISDDILSAWVEVKVEWSDLLRTPRVTAYDVGVNGERIVGVRASLDGRRVYLEKFAFAGINVLAGKPCTIDTC